MNIKNQHHLFENEHIDDYSVLNFLLQNVKGLSPSSFVPEFAVYDGSETDSE